ncbi:hypothetical protein CWE15_03475 [Aliidiomarina taiwanensis]|uniref:Toxin CptA n=1 Tax=Aliidiomarina taiwanensis TaxID=946228 RepID=A0A432XAH6_9GAMM|nr:hypothetical protein CWE15_03475 [Aliidiomarina taiwanensis]
MLAVAGMVLQAFSWLIAALGLWVMMYHGVQQRTYYFSLDAHGQGALGSEADSMYLHAPLLCTPWLLMFAVGQQGHAQRWLFIWRDSVDAAAWSRLRRIARTVTAEST